MTFPAQVYDPVHDETYDYIETDWWLCTECDQWNNTNDCETCDAH